MKLTIEIDEDTIRQVMAEYVNDHFGTDFTAENLPILVKSKNNYRDQEWEKGKIQILATITKGI